MVQKFETKYITRYYSFGLNICIGRFMFDLSEARMILNLIWPRILQFDFLMNDVNVLFYVCLFTFS